MTATETRALHKEKILAAIAARGWMVGGIYTQAASELRDAGRIKLGTRYFTGGNEKLVWVAA
jgi:hypothetical protein